MIAVIMTGWAQVAGGLAHSRQVRRGRTRKWSVATLNQKEYPEQGEAWLVPYPVPVKSATPESCNWSTKAFCMLLKMYTPRPLLT
ncbi:hypothetical protein E2C01_072132 [Portunus trituberculatus]|uniref:Uncharacterized protein n=1 Tax=Portunus trituberculatus TaxID=210409 RepID=A0A5B7I5X2_PORTR|nr:hypothetical protein [Portunus trituberculatus]